MLTKSIISEIMNYSSLRYKFAIDDINQHLTGLINEVLLEMRSFFLEQKKPLFQMVEVLKQKRKHFK
jgi:hypothetical protein